MSRIERPAVTSRRISHIACLDAASIEELGSSKTRAVGLPGSIGNVFGHGVRSIIEKSNSKTQISFAAT